MKKFTVALFTSLLIMVSGEQKVFAQTIRYVTENGAGSNNGTSWGNAYPDTLLQTAVNESGVTEVWVAKGTYKPTTGTSRTASFRMKDSVTIYGGFAGTEASISQRVNYKAGQVNETILSGDIGVAGVKSDNCYHVIYNPSSSGLTNSAVLDGFTIKGGNANRSTQPDYHGGGIFNQSSSPRINNLIICDNSATNTGGGLYCYLGNPVITNCIFTNDTAGYGGGIGMWADGVIKNCLLYDNVCGHDGGGIYIYDSFSPTITNCTIADNSAGSGGGIFVPEKSYVSINNSILWGNSASYGNQIYLDKDGMLTLNYSCYSNGDNDVANGGGDLITSNHNITNNPIFVDNIGNDFRITSESPCADAGNNSYCGESFDIRGSGYGRKLNKTTGESGTIDIGAYEYKIGADASLPVTLTDFSAQAVSGVVLLTWTTESETENLGFILERKIVGAIHESPSEWSQIASYVTEKTLTGHGSTSEKHEYQYTDKAIQPGATYLYRLADVDYSGNVTWHKEVEVKVGVGQVQMPLVFGLQPAYPNPFNPALAIPYGLTEDGQMTLKVYNLRGELIEVLKSTYALKGTYSYTWQPQELSAGIYFISLQSGNRVNLQKVVFVK